MGCTHGKHQPTRRKSSFKKVAETKVINGRKMEHSALVQGLRYNMVKLKQVKLEDIYTIFDGELGSASMGFAVRKVRKKGTGEFFACKTFNMKSMSDLVLKEKIGNMLRNEIEMLRSLDHPNVIRAYESIESDGCIHIIMELCEGGDLNSRTYTESDAAKIVCKILRAIVFCHRHLVCHRDLKFENILWESKGKGAEGEPKLIDFGMSRIFATGVMMRERVGTIYTMAPEVLRGEYTEMADLWSIGCIAFQLITGIPAFECETEADTIKKIKSVKYNWPSDIEVSPEAKEFVYKLLKYDPEKRATAQEALSSSWITMHATNSSATEPLKTVISSRTLRSMRDYSTFGPFKKTVLMILAYHLKPQELSDIRAEFAKYDTEERGCIMREELQKILEGQGIEKPEIDQLFDSMDMDQSGKIRYLEFLAATLGAKEENWLNEHRLKDAFQCMDIDNSGFIDYENLKTLLGRDYKSEKVLKMLEEAKCEPGKGVTFENFLDLMRVSSQHYDENDLLDQSRDSAYRNSMKNFRLFNISHQKGQSHSPLPTLHERSECDDSSTHERKSRSPFKSPFKAK